MCFHVCSACTDSTRASRYDHALRFMMVGGIVSGADPSQTAQGSGGDAATMRACVCARSSTVSAGQVAAVQRLGRLLLVPRARLRHVVGCPGRVVLAPCARPRRCVSSRNSE